MVCIPWSNSDKAIKGFAEIRLSLAIRVTLRFKDGLQGCPLQPTAILPHLYAPQGDGLLQGLGQFRAQEMP